MKNTDFLKTNYIINKGIYDNKNIFENTLESFTLAIDKGYILHFNIIQTKDGVIIVYEDLDLTRLMKLKDRIADTTYDELQYLCSYHIPTLEEVLNLVAGKVPVVINPHILNRKFELEKGLVNLLDEYNNQFAIISHNASVIKWFNKYRPDYIIGEVLTRKKKISKFAISNFFANYSIISDFKSINIKYYDAVKIKKIKEQTLVLAFLIDSQDKYQSFYNMVDNIFIDNVSELELK